MNYQISNSKIKINPTGLVLIYTKNLPTKYSGILITRKRCPAPGNRRARNLVFAFRRALVRTFAYGDISPAQS